NTHTSFLADKKKPALRRRASKDPEFSESPSPRFKIQFYPFVFSNLPASLASRRFGVKFPDMDAKSIALTVLGKPLQSRGYRFVAVTPATHCRVLDRPPPVTTVESIFGWNLSFDRESVGSEIFYLLERAEALEGESGRYKSKVRFATIDDLIFAHSAFPT